MKTIIFVGSKNAEGKNDVSVLSAVIRENAGDKINAATVYFEDLVFDISANSQTVRDSVSGMELSEAKLVVAANWYKSGSKNIYRDVALALGLYLQKNNVPIWNKEMVMQRSATKLSAMMQLAVNGFDIPRTIYSLSGKLAAKQTLGFPLVMKDMAASRGKNNYLVESQAELEKIFSKEEDLNRLIVQEYIPNKSDLRIVCFAGHPALVIRRSRKNNNTHLNNTSMGADADIVPSDELGQNLISDCKKICSIMGREMAGIDLIEANDGSSRQVFLEVNAIPQLTSGTYVDEKLQLLSKSIIKYLEA